MRRSTIFPCVAVTGYLVLVWLAVFVVAPYSVATADFVASTGIALPHPSGWNLGVFGNSGSPALHITVTGLVAIFGYGALIAGCAYYVGEHRDVGMQPDGGQVGGRRAESAPRAATGGEVLTTRTEGDGLRDE